MKRTLIGAALLLLLLIGAIVSGKVMNEHNESVARLLDTAAEQAMADDLPGAMETMYLARQDWQRLRNVSAAFADHDPLEQIDGGFSQLQIYGDAGETVSFAAVCVQLSQQIEALGDAHGAQWWNIL